MSRGGGKGPGDYDVGYGKPPKHTQFQPGQSGNRRGRPKRALGKHQQLLEAMDQPTREMFMAEMHRAVKVTSDGKTMKMPTIQVITRAIAKTAAGGGQQAQRTAIMLQLELERDAAATKAEIVRLARELKEGGEQLLARCRAQGVPEPELLPHPDDIFIDERTQRVEIQGPLFADQKAVLDKILADRDGYQRGVIGLQAEAAAKPRDWTLPMLAVMAQRHFDVINERLPARYRKELEGRMTAAQIKKAEERVRRAKRRSTR